MKHPVDDRPKTVTVDGSLEHWRRVVRGLVAQGIEPSRITWIDTTRRHGESVRDGRDAAPGLFDAASSLGLDVRRDSEVQAGAHPPLSLPRALVERVHTVSCHRSPQVWDVLYRVLFRVARGERDLMEDPLDPEVAAFQRLEKAVRRDAHKMHAFVRFRRVESETSRGGERFIAWYEPSHFIVEREAGFFQRRFPSMDWSILSPDRCVHWDGSELHFTGGVSRDAAPESDQLEEFWCTYYGAIFNPARVKLRAMAAEMPRKFWSMLPETAQIPELLADVPRRLEEMRTSSRRHADSSQPFVPDGASIEELGRALSGCEGCELHRDHTSPVPGEGPEHARVVLLGEQPGDLEEQTGRPFVGPAGRCLDAAIEEGMGPVGLSRGDLYLTNAVKHFRHEVRFQPGERGKRRLHKRPTIEHASRCQPWLDAEMMRVQPEVFVCLGVTAARAVFGPTSRMPKAGETPRVRTSRYAQRTIVTFHPAAILRAPNAEEAEQRRSHLVASLALAAREGLASR